MARIFVAGATGTLGRPVVSRLVAQGHAVWGTTRSEGRSGIITALGATPLVADALDAEAVRRAVAVARPEVVVHLLTALPAGGVLRASDLDATNRLREVGTRHLVDAAVANGARRLVGESFMAVTGADNPAKAALESLEAQLARARGTLDTVVLRFGALYGPEVPSTRAMVERLRARRMFVPGGREGRLSFLHIDDAVSATVAVVGAPAAGPLYSVSDDEPVSVATFIRALASSLEAPPPRSLPRWIVRLAAPMAADFASASMALDHDALTPDLGWHPAYPSIREGLASVASALRRAS
jgi:nucleoside-diphosphate-sugar epimerase